jgi:hypothetical protein
MPKIYFFGEKENWKKKNRNQCKERKEKGKGNEA